MSDTTRTRTAGYGLTVFFTKRILTGTLKGMLIQDSIPHIDKKHADRWIAGVRANCTDWEFVGEPEQVDLKSDERFLEIADRICRNITHDSFDALLNAGGSYSPSIYPDAPHMDNTMRIERRLLAALYDAAQAQRTDARRAYRGGVWEDRLFNTEDLPEGVSATFATRFGINLIAPKGKA